MSFLLPGAAFAQDGGQVCYGLEPSDCDLLYGIEDAMTDVTSFAMTYDFSVEINAEGEEIMIKSDGSGTWSEAESELAPFNLQMTVNGEATGEDMPSSGTVEFIIVDDMFYLTASEAEGQWIGFGLQEFFNAVADMAAQQGLPLDLEGLMGGEMSEDMPEMDLSPLTGLEGFATASKEVVDGTAVFVFDYDLQTLFSSDAFIEVLDVALEEAAAEAGEEATMGLNGQMVSGLAMMMLQETTLVGTEEINVETGYLEGFGIDLAIVIDPTMLGGEGDPVTMNLSFSVDISDFNGMFEYAAPAEYEELPIEMLLGMGAMME
jgi:hypothetical protein